MTVVEPGLFPEPEHTPPLTDGPWLVASPPGCWRYMFLGEDCERLMIEGHLRDDVALEVLDHAGYANFEGVASVLVHTWARQLQKCPDHESPDEDNCGFCAHMQPGAGPWWDWSTPPGEPSDFNRRTPGYFPMTVIDLEA